MNGTSQSFDVSPHTDLFQNLGSTGGTVDQAIAELVDNAADEALNDTTPVNVRIDYRVQKGRVVEISIEDDARGMNTHALAEAFRIGKSTKRTQDNKVGYFGFGLKSAISFLGQKWAVSSATSSCFNTHLVNSESFLADGNWSVIVHELPEQASSGTKIVIRDCKVHPSSLNRNLATKLAETFQHFIRSGRLNILVNGQQLQAPAVSVIPDSIIEINTVINGKPLVGWLGLRTHASPSGDYGFNLIRNNRVISSNQEIGFRREPQLSRLTGNIHLNGFEVDHGKTSFNRSNTDWVELTNYLSETVKPLLQRARELSGRDNKRLDRNLDRLLNQSLQKLVSTLEQDDFLRDLFGEAATKRPDRNGDDTSTNTVKVEVIKDEEVETKETESREIERNVPQEPKPRRASNPNSIRLRHEFSHDGREAFRKRWEVAEGILNVSVNIDHPAFPETEKQYSYALNGALEALASYLATEQSSKDGFSQPSMNQYEAILDKISRLSIENSLLGI